MASGPADRVGLAHKGRIEVGADADLVRFAPDEEFTVDVARAAPPQPGLGLRRPPARGRRAGDLAARRTRRPRMLSGDDCCDEESDELPMTYYVPKGGLPPQTALTTDRAVFTEAYAVHPGAHAERHHRVVPPRLGRDPALGAGPAAVRVRRDLQPVRRRGVARRRLGAPRARPRRRGGALRRGRRPRADASTATDHALGPGGYAYLPPGVAWTLRNGSDATATFHWIRKEYETADGRRGAHRRS